MRVRLRGINTVRKRLADGSIATYYYHRTTGHPLPGEPGSPEFMKAHADAERMVEATLDGTFAHLTDSYINSPEFAKLAASTQEAYRGIIRRANIEFGDMPQAALDEPAVRGVFMDYRAKVAKQSGEREADTRLSVISAILTWAVANSHLRANNVAGFKRIYQSDRSELIWKPEDITAFMAVAPLELQRAMILAVHSGQRQGDLLKLCWTQYDGAFIRLRQGKSRRLGKPGPLIEIPVTQALKRMLDSMPRVATTILTSRTGRPFQRRHFCKLWIEATRAAGIADLHFHDLRGTAVTLLSEAGSPLQEIAAITGHSLRSASTILDKYLARTRALAEQAIFRFENSPRTDFANRLQTGPSGQIKGEQRK